MSINFSLMIEIIGNHYMIIFENNDQLIEIIQNVEVNQERVFESEFILKVGRKKITVNLSCSPVFDDSDTFSGIVVAFDDLSKINKVYLIEIIFMSANGLETSPL